MNLEKVVFGFFITSACALNFGFVTGDIGDPELHNAAELVAALIVSVVATVLKFGDRTQLGAVHLATSLVADLQLVAACTVYVWAVQVSPLGLSRGHMSLVVSLSLGALLANIVSVVLMVGEILQQKR